MEPNQSQVLETPIAMAAKIPESDKAHSPSLPPLSALSSAPLPRAARSHALSALGRVNHSKDKEMKGSPIGELSVAY